MRFVLHQVKGLAHFYFIQATLVETCSPAFEEGKNRESQSRCVPTDSGSSISFIRLASASRVPKYWCLSLLATTAAAL
jgi:hypothetical protein